MEYGKEERSLGAGMVIGGYTLLVLARTTLLMIAYASCFMPLTSELLFPLSALLTPLLPENRVRCCEIVSTFLWGRQSLQFQL